MNPNNKFEVKTSNFQDWFLSGPIKIEIEKKYADKKENLNHLIELTIEYIKEKGLKINKKEKEYILELFFESSKIVFFESKLKVVLLLNFIFRLLQCFVLFNSKYFFEFLMYISTRLPCLAR